MTEIDIKTFQVPVGYQLVKIPEKKKHGRKSKLESMDPADLTPQQRWKLNYRLKHKEQIKAYQDAYNKRYYEKQKVTRSDTNEINLNELD